MSRRCQIDELVRYIAGLGVGAWQKYEVKWGGPGLVDDVNGGAGLC
jgi:hypothetical protein